VAGMETSWDQRGSMIDAVKVVDDHIDAILARPAMFVPSTNVLEIVLLHFLGLRNELAGNEPQNLTMILFKIARERGVKTDARGPSPYLTKRHRKGLGSKKVMAFYRALVERCRAEQVLP